MLFQVTMQMEIPQEVLFGGGRSILQLGKTIIAGGQCGFLIR
jgi:hypothetical protein